MNNNVLPIIMASKIIFFLMLMLVSCDNVSYQNLIVDYKNKNIKILSEEYVIDSIALTNQNKIYLIIELKKNHLGRSSINLSSIDHDYIIHLNKLDSFNCSGAKWETSLSVYIRPKGKKISFEQRFDRRTRQEFSLNHYLCDNTVDTLRAERFYR